MSVRAIILAIAVGSAVVATPATAATYLITYTGVVTDGVAAGAFGYGGGDLTGQSFKAVYRLTFPTPGAFTFVNNDFAETYGGDNSATPSPVYSARLTINGVTETLYGTWWGYAYLQNGLGTYLGADGIGNQVNDYYYDGITYRNSYLVNSIYSDVDDFVHSTNFSAPLDYTFLPGDTRNSEFQIITHDFSRYTYQFAEGHLSSQRVTIAAVPEPVTWTMMLAGFGLTGATMRRRRAAVAPA
jgi:hypothetical protein